MIVRDFLDDIALALCRFLEKQLPELSDSWWEERVLSKVKDHVRDKIRSRRWSSLAEFDLSILLSVLIGNYQDLSDGWPDHGWSTVHEMLHIRNKCAHQPASSPPPNRWDTLHDLGVLIRFVRMVGPNDPICSRLENERDRQFGKGPVVRPGSDQTIDSSVSPEHLDLLEKGFDLDPAGSDGMDAAERGLLRKYGGWLEAIIHGDINPATDDERIISETFGAAPSDPHELLVFLIGLETSVFSPAIKPLINSWKTYEGKILVAMTSKLVPPPGDEIEEPAEVVVSEPDDEERTEVAADDTSQKSEPDTGEDITEDGVAAEEAEEPAEVAMSPPHGEEKKTVAIPESFQELDPGILLWGGPGSGKSTYASSLVFHREREDESGESDWYVMPADLEAAEFVADVVLAYRAREAPPKTDLVRPLRFRVTEMRRPKKFLGRLKTPARPKRETIFNFVDPRGETFTNEGITGQQGQIILDLLANAEGLLLLIDPTNTQQGDYLRMFVMNLVRMFEHMRSLGGSAAKKVEGDQLHIPVAICLTKMDRFPGQDERTLLLDTVGEDSFRHLRGALGEYEIFGLSALGPNVVDDGGVMRPPDGLAQPWEALTPLKWLVDRK